MTFSDPLVRVSHTHENARLNRSKNLLNNLLPKVV